MVPFYTDTSALTMAKSSEKCIPEIYEYLSISLYFGNLLKMRSRSLLYRSILSILSILSIITALARFVILKMHRKFVAFDIDIRQRIDFRLICAAKYKLNLCIAIKCERQGTFNAAFI